MRTFVNKKTIKNLILIMAIIIFLSALVPVSVHAQTDTEDGGDILHPIENFVLFLGDKVMGWLQNTFVSPENIEIEEDVWDFKYSPSIIFSGTVPALDINFINPGETKAGTKTSVEHVSLIEALETNGANKIEGKEYSAIAGANVLEEIKQKYKKSQSQDIDLNSLGGNLKSIETDGPHNNFIGPTMTSTTAITTQELIYAWSDDTKIFIIVDYQYLKTTDMMPVSQHYEYIIYEVPSLEDLKEATKITDTVAEIKVATKEYESTASVLQSTIATWYNVLRRIALVGLLSVLVYVGIRIVLSSSAGDKAKYKAMIKDWLVALCILFTLHYIMSITITVTNEISDVFQTGESDVLLNTLRQEIFAEGDSGVALAKTIMYATLVILTVTFTIQYIKRVIYMAFYTLIAPLITLTYPLDKIKDGQAQAFSMWIREYLYTALTQIIHLVIYTVLVGSALDLVSVYPLYAIIVLFFIKKADGIIKKMFGFDKSETVGTLGAAATGALVVNALNSLARKGRFKKEQFIR